MDYTSFDNTLSHGKNYMQFWQRLVDKTNSMLFRKMLSHGKDYM